MRKRWTAGVLAFCLVILMLAGCGKKQENAILITSGVDSPYAAKMDEKCFFKSYYNDIYCWDGETVTLVRECAEQEDIQRLYAWKDRLYYVKYLPYPSGSYKLALCSYSPERRTEAEVMILDEEAFCFQYGWMENGTYFWWDCSRNSSTSKYRINRYDLSSGQITSMPVEESLSPYPYTLAYQGKLYLNSCTVTSEGTNRVLAAFNPQNGKYEDLPGHNNVLGAENGKLIYYEDISQKYRSLDPKNGITEEWHMFSGKEYSLLSVNEEAAFLLSDSDGLRHYSVLTGEEIVQAASFQTKNSNVSGALLDSTEYQSGDTLYFRSDTLPEGEYIDLAPKIKVTEKYLEGIVYQYALKSDGTLYLLLKEQQRWLFA